MLLFSLSYLELYLLFQPCIYFPAILGRMGYEIHFRYPFPKSLPSGKGLAFAPLKGLVLYLLFQLCIYFPAGLGAGTTPRRDGRWRCSNMARDSP